LGYNNNFKFRQRQQEHCKAINDVNTKHYIFVEKINDRIWYNSLTSKERSDIYDNYLYCVKYFPMINSNSDYWVYKHVIDLLMDVSTQDAFKLWEIEIRKIIPGNLKKIRNYKLKQLGL